MFGSSYPEGNFGVNQLLDGSMSLSPLYPAHTSDLHVSIATVLHQSFLRLQPRQAKFTIFRVLTNTLRLITAKNRRPMMLQAQALAPNPFQYALWFHSPQNLRIS